MTTCTHASAGCDYPASECAGHCTRNVAPTMPEALRLADALEAAWSHYVDTSFVEVELGAAAELRRLHAENTELTIRLAHATERALVHKERADKLQTQLEAAAEACNKLAAHVDDLLKQRDYWYARLLAEVGKHNKLEVSK